MISLSMAVALVTGANRGLGLEWTRQLLHRGDTVFATCRHPRMAPQLDELGTAYSDRLHKVELDVTEPDSIRRAVQAVEEETSALHLLINNAGVNGGGRSDAFGALEQERMLHVLNVNTVGPHLLAQAAANLLKTTAAQEEATPKVINITSQLGSIARVRGQAAWQSYRASKAALNMLTRLLAFEMKPHEVIAVALHPGWVRTKLGGSGAALAPRESVRGMLEVVDALTMEDAGTFCAWDGHTLPW